VGAWVVLARALFPLAASWCRLEAAGSEKHLMYLLCATKNQFFVYYGVENMLM